MSFSGCGNLPRVRYGQETVKMAVLPAYSLEQMTRRYLPLLRHLSSETGYDVQYVTSGSYNAFGVTVEGSGAQLVLCDPLAFLTLRKTMQAELLAVGVCQGGGVSAPGLIVVKGPQAAAGLGQLRGKRVGFASQRSAEGFLSQAMAMADFGMDARRDLDLIACLHMDEVVRRLRNGQLDAGFIGLAVWDEELSRDLAILARTAPVPTWVVASLPGSAPEIKTKISSALMAMDAKREDHQRILNQLRLDGFAGPTAGMMDELARNAEKAKIPY